MDINDPEPLAKLTPAGVVSLLVERGWRSTATVDHETLGPMACLVRDRKDGPLDHTAVPIEAKTEAQRAALAQALAAHAHRDGLDLDELLARFPS